MKKLQLVTIDVEWLFVRGRDGKFNEIRPKFSREQIRISMALTVVIDFKMVLHYSTGRDYVSLRCWMGEKER